MKNKLIILFLMLIVLPSVLAVSVTYTYTTVSSDVNAVVYKILDNSKFGEFSSGINNKITINYIIDNPSTIYNTYHYKQGYKPYLKTLNSDGYIGFIIKQSNCKSSIKSVSIPSNLQPNTDFTITVNLEDITDIFTSLTIPSSIPSELTEYYKADTNVKLYINTQPPEEKTIKISTTGNAVTFTKQLPSGPHTIKITTDVTDDQCDTVNSPPIQDENVQTVTITQPSNPCTSSDWSCTQWSSCTNSQQTKTCSKTPTCEGTTGKPAETQSCYQCSDSYDNDNDGKIDLQDPGCSSLTDNNETDIEACSQSGLNCPPNADTKCPTGHPKCSCTGEEDLKKYLCSQTQECKGTSLNHNEPGLGTCCSIQCTEKPKAQTPCTEENKIKLCPPDQYGCVMKKTCKNSYWTDCEKFNPDCVQGSSCIDGTPAGQCSNKTIGKLCDVGTLIYDALCLKVPCSPNWYCTFTDCIDNSYKRCLSGYIDLNKCNITTTPSDTQPCTYQNPITEEEYQTRLKSAEGEIKAEESDLKAKEESPSIQASLKEFFGIPKTFSVKIGFETPFVLLIIAVFLIAITVYYFKRPKETKIKEKGKKIEKKQETHPVKVNELLLSVIESLEGDEKRIANKLIEIEGVRVSKLREILGINKTKMEIALQKLEKRQIIKERTEDDSKLYFNDWLK